MEEKKEALQELSLDEMEWVAAAGIPETKPEDKENKGN